MHFEVPTFTARDWQLYTDRVASRVAAADLNIELHLVLLKYAAGTLNEAEVKREMLKVMDRYADLGARDTEPRAFLSIIVRKCCSAIDTLKSCGLR